ncbi:MAG: cytochrome C oxidase subunit IV family protein [Saprospiraceae bacterium]|nr:cytochrome C oxidase subunit IV family protein [Saprospiraceae bacterium]
MGHSYEKSKKIAFKTINILGLITIVEVVFALAGKGYIIEGVEVSTAIMALVMIALSLTKAYLIVYEFMHMKYEVPALVKTVLLPVGLLIWAVIAFFTEGNTWLNYRSNLKEKNEEKVENREVKPPAKQESMILINDHNNLG